MVLRIMARSLRTRRSRLSGYRVGVALTVGRSLMRLGFERHFMRLSGEPHKARLSDDRKPACCPRIQIAQAVALDRVALHKRASAVAAGPKAETAVVLHLIARRG